MTKTYKRKHKTRKHKTRKHKTRKHKSRKHKTKKRGGAIPSPAKMKQIRDKVLSQVPTPGDAVNTAKEHSAAAFKKASNLATHIFKNPAFQKS
jgi:hypothetical protein